MEDKLQTAADFRARGEQTEKEIGAALSIVGAVIEGGVGALSGDPAAVMKPAYDMLAALIGLKFESELVKEADRLEQEARAMKRDDLADRYGRATKNLRHAGNMLEKTHQMSKDVELDYIRQYQRATGEFDRTTQGASALAISTSGAPRPRPSHLGLYTRSAGPAAVAG